jgi:deferrochelatase/peroxidase EfeB
MPYGPEYDSAPQQERGLAFLALNADLEGQFEFIQRQWVNGGEFIGLSDDERDPLVGQNSDGQFTIPSGSISPFVFGLNRFVTTQGGGYFFMPGIEAMRRLADDLF